jgi:dephospho-CoA kinase
MTGGIGSGKSLAAAHFATLGADVIDTDQISRRLTGPGGPAMAAIVARFGVGMRADDGGLDRARMRSLVFADPSARQDLEGILHPCIRQQAAIQVQASRGPYVVLVVPLLLETGAYAQSVDRILVLDCPEALQVARAVARDGLDPAVVRSIMASQSSRAQRLAAADDVIDNSGTVAKLEAQIAKLHEKYLQLAQEMRA